MAPGTGRAAQRRRTRRAIVDATTGLLQSTAAPTVDAIAAAAEVSRRTVYLYFPTLEQLHLEATQGALLDTDMDARLSAAATSGDARQRVDALISEFVRMSATLLPLGRRLIRLTVDPPETAAEPDPDTPRRGYRRVEWIEKSVEPLRAELSDEQVERLVSGLAMVIGWEGMIVLRDLRGLDHEAEQRVTRWAARALVDAIHAEGSGVG